jgi:hypothetical protein
VTGRAAGVLEALIIAKRLVILRSEPQVTEFQQEEPLKAASL